jgi:hypothetical protein
MEEINIIWMYKNNEIRFTNIIDNYITKKINFIIKIGSKL